MTSVKPRPANASGPNGLRGGIKQFIPKTITGRWLEEVGGPAGYRRGFTTVEYETEAQYQQTGARFRLPKEFGPELPDEHYSQPPSSPFKYESKTSDPTEMWMTTSRDHGMSILKRDKKKEEETSLKSHLDRETLENYRKTWSSDPEFQRHRRFVTETRLANGVVGKQFTVATVRPLPGTPKSLELCREQLVEKYGLFALTMVKAMLGSDTEVPAAEFRRAISSLGCNLKPYQLNQIIAYITPGDTVPMEQFLYVLRGNSPPLDHDQPENFAAMSNLLSAVENYARENSNSGRINFERHVLNFVRSNEHPEVLEALRDYARPVYVRNEEDVQIKELQLMLEDMYSVSPDSFAKSMAAMWTV